MSTASRSSSARVRSAVTVTPWALVTAGPSTPTSRTSMPARRSRSAGTKASLSSNPVPNRIATM